MNRKLATLAAALLALGLGTSAQASTITFHTSSSVVPDLGTEDFEFVGGTDISGASWALNNAVITSGSVPGLWAKPSGDDTLYANVFGGGSITLSLSTPGRMLSLLWGSVDTYNTIQFFDAANVLLGSFTGLDVLPPANGNQGAAGTLLAYFTSSTPFSKVVFSSSGNSFEFDNVSVATTPIPAALPMFGAALAGLGALARRRRKIAA